MNPDVTYSERELKYRTAFIYAMAFISGFGVGMILIEIFNHMNIILMLVILIIGTFPLFLYVVENHRIQRSKKDD